MSIFRKFNVKLQFRNRIYGGLPKSKELVKNYVEAKFGSEDASIVETDLDLEEEEEKVRTGFKRCPARDALYIGDYAVKAMMKQCISLLKLTVQLRGSKQTLREGTAVKGLVGDKLTEEKVFFQPFRPKEDGIEDFAGHVQTMQGMRSILKSAEYLIKPTLEFQIWCLGVRMEGTKDVNPDHLQDILELGQEVGLGSQRSFEKGKFDVVEFSEIDPPVKKKKKGAKK